MQSGLTGWQVSRRNDIGFDERIEMDPHYIREQSVWTDLKLLFRTVTAVLGIHGSY